MPKSKVQADTKGKLAQAIPCTKQTLDRLWKLPGHPMPTPYGKHDIASWRRFYAQHRLAHNAKVLPGESENGSNGFNSHVPTNAREQSIIDKNRVSAAAAQFELDVKMGEYVRRIEVNRDIDTANAVLRREMIKLVTHILPAKCQGLTAAEMSQVGLDELNRVITLLPGHMLKAIRVNGTTQA